MPVFERFELVNFRQFARLEFDLHPKVTIITGANGAGKSTVLGLLARSIHGQILSEINSSTLVGTESQSNFLPPIRGRDLVVQHGSQRFHQGSVVFDNRYRADIVVWSRSNQPEYEVRFEYRSREASINSGQLDQPIPELLGVRFVFFDSHRNSFRPTQVGPISNEYGKWWNKADATEPVGSKYWTDYLNRHGQGHPPNYQMKEAMISWAAFGPGSDYLVPQPDLVRMWESFQAIARRLLPESLGFVQFVVQSMDIYVVTRTGQFPLDSLSGGMSALLEYAWTLHLLDPENQHPTVVFIDEAENHLHASMQRELLPKLSIAFPDTQFIVTTHSPLIASSIRDAKVVALRQNDEGFIESIDLELDEWAGSASDVLRDVLGLSSTVPTWAAQLLGELVDKLSTRKVTTDLVNEVYKELGQAGLGEFAADIVAGVGTREFELE